MVADAQFAHVAIRHFDVTAEKFADAARSVAESTPRVLEAVARWQEVQLTELERDEFARRAIALRWEPEDNATRLLVPSKLLRPVRYGDHHTDLWTTFNISQEHLLRGGIDYAGYVPADPGATFPTHFVRNTTRPVTGLAQAARLNKALWSLAEEFANN